MDIKRLTEVARLVCDYNRLTISSDWKEFCYMIEYPPAIALYRKAISLADKLDCAITPDMRSLISIMGSIMDGDDWDGDFKAESVRMRKYLDIILEKVSYQVMQEAAPELVTA